VIASGGGLAFKSRAVRSLVELHEAEYPRFLDAWERFAASVQGAILHLSMQLVRR